MLRIRGFSLLINVARPFNGLSVKPIIPHTAIPLSPLWQSLLTRFVIHPILPRILIAVPRHGKAPSIDNHPNTELTHHSEAPVDALI